MAVFVCNKQGHTNLSGIGTFPHFFQVFVDFLVSIFLLADLAGGFLHWAGCGRDRESFDFQRQSLEFGMGKT